VAASTPALETGPETAPGAVVAGLALAKAELGVELGGMPGALGPLMGEFGTVPPGLGLPAWIFAPATFELGAAPPTLVADPIGRGAGVAEFG